jgi:nicotinate-nucleotide adenylyltransferase
MNGPIGILGGTYDPVHHGHLRLALECQQAVGLDQVNLVPLHRPAHRGGIHASAEQRLQMLRLATEGMPRLHVDDIEIRRDATSWTIDTVTEYRRLYPARPLCLIMGMDSFCNLHQWKQWELIPEQVHIIVATRPETDDGAVVGPVAAIYAARHTDNVADIHQAPAGRIIRIQIPPLAISSTRIRRLLLAGQDPAFLLPEKVLTYIYDNKIYPETS